MSAARTRLAAAALVIAATPAQAHVVVEGLSGFPGGLLHPLLVPAHGLALFALGLAIGLQVPSHRLALPAIFFCAMGGAAALVMSAFSAATPEHAVLASGALAGLLAACGRPLPLILTGLLAIATAGAILFDSVPVVISAYETLFSLAGTALAATALVALIAMLAALCRRQWQIIGLRIAGSWSAAIALMVLALRLTR